MPFKTPTDWRPLFACCLATFLLLAYTTIVTVSVPVIANDLDADFAVSQWIIDAYTLPLAALVLGMGTLGDRLGHRRLFLIGLVAFGATSAACAMATSGGWLVVARAGQGCGGAAILASVVPLLTRSYEGARRGTAFAVWSSVAAAGSTVGTVAGGAVTQFVSWRWLFIGAVPLCIAALALGVVALRAERPGRVRVDAVGTVFVTASMTGITYAIVNAGENGWTSMGTIAGAVVGLVAGASFIPAQRAGAHPVLPPNLFHTRTFSAVLVVGFAYYFGAFAALPVLSRWLQTSMGLPPLHASLILASQLLAFIVASLALSAVTHRAPTGWVLGGGTIIIGLACMSGTALLAWPHWTTPIVALVLTGVGAGIVSPVLPAVAATSVPPSRAGTAAAAANAARQLGLTVGIALCGSLSRTADLGATGGVVVALATSGAIALGGGAVGMVLLRSSDQDRTSARRGTGGSVN